MQNSVKGKMQILLRSDNTVKLTQGFSGDQQPREGKWTMIYDEAMEIKIESFSFFFFFSYSDPHGWEKSDCSKTLIGNLFDIYIYIFIYQYIFIYIYIWLDWNKYLFNTIYNRFINQDIPCKILRKHNLLDVKALKYNLKEYLI